MIPDLGPFLHLRRYVSIAHHVPGRIRLKLDFAALAQLPKADPKPFVELVGRIRGVTTTRVNAAALSVVVEYDPHLIPAPLWPRLLVADAEEVAQVLATHVS